MYGCIFSSSTYIKILQISERFFQSLSNLHENMFERKYIFNSELEVSNQYKLIFDTPHFKYLKPETYNK